MKFVRENFFLFYLLLVVGIIFIEISFFGFSYVYSKFSANAVFNKATDISRSKISLITEILNNSTLTYFSKFRSDLILVGKHMLLLKSINKDLQYYKNYKEKKIIVSGHLEELINNSILNQFYDNISKGFNYIRKYELFFDSPKESNSIIDSLLEHEELNLIAYYKNKKNFSVNNIDNITNIIGKYLISILKTLYIGRYFIKRSKIEYIRFILFHEDECFIYPPDAYNNTDSYDYNEKVIGSNDFPFPYSFYNYLNSNFENKYWKFIQRIHS